jgi:hypothetical protein
MARLTADFSAVFTRDLEKKARRRNGDLYEMQIMSGILAFRA